MSPMLQRLAQLNWTLLAILAIGEASLVGGLAWIFWEEVWPLVFLVWFGVSMLAYGIVKHISGNPPRPD
ncbi:MAG: hypothetical protein FJY35_04785 [Betaproteobacteria bacterium]|nr:hypothetical protein [Betaproteobacteria bacterium]